MLVAQSNSLFCGVGVDEMKLIETNRKSSIVIILQLIHNTKYLD